MKTTPVSAIGNEILHIRKLISLENLIRKVNTMKNMKVRKRKAKNESMTYLQMKITQIITMRR